MTKVPILGDIPIIGRLFRSNGNSNNKVNVVIYITPYIIKKSSDLTTLRVRLGELESVQQQYDKIIMAQLAENGELDTQKEKRHETFSTSSKPRRNPNYTSAIPATLTLPYSESSSQPTVQYVPETVTTTPQISYEQDNDYIQSESIMDTFEQNNAVNLTPINSGNSEMYYQPVDIDQERY